MPSSRVCLHACLLELIGEYSRLNLSGNLDKSANQCLFRDLTIAASRCINKQAFYIGNGVMNIVSKSSSSSAIASCLAKTEQVVTADLMILALPIPIVWRLTLELRQKIILSVVFTLGSMYVLALPLRAVEVAVV